MKEAGVFSVNPGANVLDPISPDKVKAAPTKMGGMRIAPEMIS